MMDKHVTLNLQKTISVTLVFGLEYIDDTRSAILYGIVALSSTIITI